MVLRTLGLSALLCTLLFAWGCGSCAAQGSFGTPYDPAKVSLIRVGQTTRAQIAEWFGPEYIQEKEPNTIRYEQWLTEASANMFHCRCWMEPRGVSIRFENDVVAEYRLIGAQ